MNETLSRVERRERPLATGGVAVYFATGFAGAHGDVAVGPFEVSADRYDVTVYRATLITEADFEVFQEAMIRARVAHLSARGGWVAPSLQDAAALALAELEAVQAVDGAAPSTARAIETLRAAVAANGGGD